MGGEVDLPPCPWNSAFYFILLFPLATLQPTHYRLPLHAAEFSSLRWYMVFFIFYSFSAGRLFSRSVHLAAYLTFLVYLPSFPVFFLGFFFNPLFYFCYEPASATVLPALFGSVVGRRKKRILPSFDAPTLVATRLLTSCHGVNLRPRYRGLSPFPLTPPLSLSLTFSPCR